MNVFRPSPPRRPSLMAQLHTLSPRTPDESRGEQDYFSRPVTIPTVTIDPTHLSPHTLERIAPIVEHTEIVERPVRVNRFWGRRIPLPVRLAYTLAGMATVALVSALSTLGIAIANRRAREEAGHPA